MIKYYSLDQVSSLFKLDSEKDTACTIDYIRSNIDWVYRIPEDGFLVTQEGNQIEVKANDIVLKMYSHTQRYGDPKEFIVVKDKDIIDYYSRYIEQIKKRKEEEASNNCSCEDCDTCDDD